MWHNLVCLVQWTLTNPNSLEPGPIRIREKFGLVKVINLIMNIHNNTLLTAACSSSSLYLIFFTFCSRDKLVWTLFGFFWWSDNRSGTTAIVRVQRLRTSCACATTLTPLNDPFQVILRFGKARFRINGIRINESPL